MLAFLFLFKHFKKLQRKRKDKTDFLEDTKKHFTDGESNVPAVIGLSGKTLKDKEDSIKEEKCESELV